MPPRTPLERFNDAEVDPDLLAAALDEIYMAQEAGEDVPDLLTLSAATYADWVGLDAELDEADLDDEALLEAADLDDETEDDFDEDPFDDEAEFDEDDFNEEAFDDEAVATIVALASRLSALSRLMESGQIDTKAVDNDAVIVAASACRLIEKDGAPAFQLFEFLAHVRRAEAEGGA
jgi:hypothetical protein